MKQITRHYYGKPRRPGEPPEYLRAKEKLRLALILFLAAAVVIFLLIMLSQWENSYYGDRSLSESINSWQLYHRTLDYEGETWRERSGLESYLLIGVDTTGDMEGKKSTEGAGQADTVMLLVVDNRNETWRVLQLNRDGIVDIPVLGINGETVKTRQAQLALSYAYGDGREGSCENTVTAVSDLLEGQKINGYLAVNIDSIAFVTDLLGGVTVTLPADYSSIKSGWTEGAEIELTGADAELMVRQRYDIGDRTNLTRMERQLAFWEPFTQKLFTLDEEALNGLISAMEDKTVTDLSAGVMTKLRNKLASYTDLGILTIDGENRLLGENWAYYMDPDSLTRTTLTLFFQKK